MARLALVVAISLGTVACSESPEDILEEARSLQSQGRIPESIPLLAKLIDSGYRDGEAMYRYGRALSLTGLPGRGIWALDAALQDPDWFIQASHQIALDAYRSKNQELALETLERLRAERQDSHADDLPALLLELRVRVETRRQYEAALELAEEIIDDYPDNEEVIRLKAVALIGLKETDEAYELIRDAGLLASGIEADLAGEADAGSDEPGVEGEDPEEVLSAGANQREAYWCTVRATFKREAGEPDEATEIVNECLERFPSNTALVNEAIKLFSKTNRFDRILEVLRRANKENPEDRDMRLALVQYLGSINDKAGAESVLRGAIEAATQRFDDGDPQAEVQMAMGWVDLGGYLVDRGEREEALVAYDEALLILGERAAPEFLFLHADALILAGRYDDALAIAERTPIEVHRPMIRGRVAFERGEFSKALEQLNEAALAWPDNAPVRYYLARTHEALGDFDNAIEEYRQAMRSDPKLSAARERLARLHLAEGRVRHASTILNFISPRETSKPSPEMKLLQIEVQSRLGQETSLAIPPTPDLSIDVLRRRAIQSLARGIRLQSDAKTAEKFIADLEANVDPEAKPVFFRERVALMLIDGDVDKAVRLATRRAAERPDDLDLALALGRALVASGSRLDEAEKALNRVVEARPDEFDALLSLGDLAVKRGNAIAAADFYDRALVLSPDSWDALSRRVDILVTAGKPDEALTHLRHYIAVDNPFEGRAALELASLLGEQETEREKRIELAKTAIRFGAGIEALELLKQLDPEAASKYSVHEPAPSEASASEQTPRTDAETTKYDAGKAKAKS